MWIPISTELSGVKLDAPDRAEKLKEFARRFMEAAFRRPLSEEYKQIVEKQFAAAKTPEIAVKRVVLFTLKSPRFLYPDFREEAPAGRLRCRGPAGAGPVGFHPGQAAHRGRRRRETEDARANRRASRAHAARSAHEGEAAGFFHHWLELERAEAISKDPKVFPEFDAAVLSDLRTSLKLFLDQVVWSERSDYRELLQADYLLLNERLGKLYGKGRHRRGFPAR